MTVAEAVAVGDKDRVPQIVYHSIFWVEGLPDAIEATWPQATIQTCVLHLLHAPSRYVSGQDKTRVLTELKNIYNTPGIDATQTAFTDSETGIGTKYPAIIGLWRNQRRFSIERSALKLIYFAINNIKTKRGGPQPTNTPGWTDCINQPAVHYHSNHQPPNMTTNPPYTSQLTGPGRSRHVSRSRCTASTTWLPTP